MKTRVILTFERLTAREREELPELFDDALVWFLRMLEECSSTTANVRQTDLAKRLRGVVWNMEFVDVAMIVPDPDGDHPKREDEP